MGGWINVSSYPQFYSYLDLDLFASMHCIPLLFPDNSNRGTANHRPEHHNDDILQCSYLSLSTGLEGGFGHISMRRLFRLFGSSKHSTYHLAPRRHTCCYLLVLLTRSYAHSESISSMQCAVAHRLCMEDMLCDRTNGSVRQNSPVVQVNDAMRDEMSGPSSSLFTNGMFDVMRVRSTFFPSRDYFCQDAFVIEMFPK